MVTPELLRKSDHPQMVFNYRPPLGRILEVGAAAACAARDGSELNTNFVDSLAQTRGGVGVEIAQKRRECRGVTEAHLMRLAKTPKRIVRPRRRGIDPARVGRVSDPVTWVRGKNPPGCHHSSGSRCDKFSAIHTR